MRLVDDYVNNRSFCCNGDGDFYISQEFIRHPGTPFKGIEEALIDA
ncbi:MAG: hypothetical protein J5875_07980 [Paludibacteraceae bacterium]|nr:hypothetical protein [Paludibacteraceae bacterium]